MVLGCWGLKCQGVRVLGYQDARGVRVLGVKVLKCSVLGAKMLGGDYLLTSGGVLCSPGLSGVQSDRDPNDFQPSLVADAPSPFLSGHSYVRGPTRSRCAAVASSTLPGFSTTQLPACRHPVEQPRTGCPCWSPPCSNSYRRSTPTTSQPRCVPTQPWALTGRGEQALESAAVRTCFGNCPIGARTRFRVQVVSPDGDTNTGYTPLCSRVPIRRESWLISPKKVGYSVRHLMYIDVRVLGCQGVWIQGIKVLGCSVLGYQGQGVRKFGCQGIGVC